MKITGMNPAEEIPPDVAHRAYFRQPVWKRIVVISAGPAVNIALAFLILWVLIWANGEQEGTGKVERVTAAPARGELAPGDRSCPWTASRGLRDAAGADLLAQLRGRAGGRLQGRDARHDRRDAAR